VSYYFSKTVAMPIDRVVEHVTAALASKGFGVLTTIDVAATMKKKLDIEFRPYIILGACNPQFAHEALSIEDKIGTMLPCNVVIQQIAEGRVEIAAVDPVASMSAIHNPALAKIASQVRELLRSVVVEL
jgi:uncharacterized protein (DUF302 family)